MSLALIMMTIGCSNKYLATNNYCENLPDITWKHAELVYGNQKFKPIKLILIQIQSIKECGCIESSLQTQCFERFKSEKNVDYR